MSTVVKNPNLKMLARALEGVAQKKALVSKDLEILSSIRSGISEILRQLKECDVCGVAVTEIAHLEIDGTKAHVCHHCGIRALRDKKLHLKKRAPKKVPTPKQTASKSKSMHKTVKSSTHKPAVIHASPSTHTPTKKSKIPPTVQASLPLVTPKVASSSTKGGNGSANFDELAESSGLKIGVLRKIHKIASEIAMPMSFDMTVSYTRAEAGKDNIRLEDSQLKKVLREMVDKHGVRVRA